MCLFITYSTFHYFNVYLFPFLFLFHITFFVYASVFTIYIENLRVICARMSTHYLIWYTKCVCVCVDRTRITNLISYKVWCTNIQTHTWLLKIAQSAQQHSRQNPIQKRYIRSVDKRKAMKHLRGVCMAKWKCKEEWTKSKSGYHFILHTWFP